MVKWFRLKFRGFKNVQYVEEEEEEEEEDNGGI